MMWEICVCVRPLECKRVVVCYSYIYIFCPQKNQSITVFGLFPEDENYTCQTG